MPVHPGTSLRDHVAVHGPWTADTLERLGTQLASVLSAAHHAGVVHRDVSPTNVLIDGAGDAVLSDFDLARLDDGQTANTVAVLGTPGFTAPELLEGGRADPRSDLYALGAVLYLAATGTPPFGSDQAMAIVRRQLDGRFRSLREARPDLPPALAQTIDLLLSTDPGARPSTAREVEDLLRRPIEPVAPAPGEAVPINPRLPTGPYAVHVREHVADQERRERLRQQQQRLRVALAVVGQDQQASNALATALQTLGHASPEHQLAEAVARVAGLPPDALAVEAPVYEARFKLVDGVSAEAAEVLQRAATQAGFVAEVQKPRVVDEVDLSDPWDTWAPPPDGANWLGGALLMAGAFGFFVAPLWSWSLGGSLAVFGTSIVAWSLAAQMASPDPHEAYRQLDDDEPLEPPTAYGHDLRAHLRKEAPPLVARPRPAAVVDPPPSAPTRKAPAPPRRDPAQNALAAVLARVDALAADAERATHLARPMHDDLMQHIHRLRDEAVRLHQACERVDALLSAHAPQLALEEAADQLQRRIRRLQTLQRAGREVDQAELDQLERSFEQHLEQLLASDALEARRVQAVARLLEIGAVANEVRRDLFGVELTRSLDDVLAQVRSEVAAGQRALAEVEQPVVQAAESPPARVARAAASARQTGRPT
jgi:hypothetical protein